MLLGFHLVLVTLHVLLTINIEQEKYNFDTKHIILCSIIMREGIIAYKRFPFIQPKSPKTICSVDGIIFSGFDFLINFNNPNLIYSKSFETNQPQI